MNKKIKEKIEDLIVLIAGAIIWISFLYAICLLRRKPIQQ